MANAYVFANTEFGKDPHNGIFVLVRADSILYRQPCTPMPCTCIQNASCTAAGSNSGLPVALTTVVVVGCGCSGTTTTSLPSSAGAVPCHLSSGHGPAQRRSVGSRVLILGLHCFGFRLDQPARTGDHCCVSTIAFLAIATHRLRCGWKVHATPGFASHRPRRAGRGAGASLRRAPVAQQ